MQLQFPIGAVAGVTATKWLKTWDARHPDEPAHLVRLAEGAQADALHSHEVMMCLARDFTETAGVDLHRVSLYSEVQVAIAPKDHFIAAADEVTYADVADELAQLPEDMGWEDRISIAATGAGVVLAPHAVARTYNRKDLISRPVTDLARSHVDLVWLRDLDDDRTQDFVGIVKGRTVGSSRS